MYAAFILRVLSKRVAEKIAAGRKSRKVWGGGQIMGRKNENSREEAQKAQKGIDAYKRNEGTKLGQTNGGWRIKRLFCIRCSHSLAEVRGL
jgi:hypothetical protein